MKFKFSLILILFSFKSFSQIEPKIYVCNTTNFFKLQFEEESYYYKPIKKMNECNVLIISDSTIQLFNNDFQIK
jgi:hypothetical protein